MEGRINSDSVLLVDNVYERNSSLPKLISGITGEELSERQRAVKRHLFDESGIVNGHVVPLPTAEINVGTTLVYRQESVISHKRMKLEQDADVSCISCSTQLEEWRKVVQQAMNDSIVDPSDMENFSSGDEEGIDYPSASEDASDSDTYSSSAKDESDESSIDEREDSAEEEGVDTSEDEETEDSTENEVNKIEHEASSEDEDYYYDIEDENFDRDLINAYVPPQYRATVAVTASSTSVGQIIDPIKRIAQAQALKIAYSCVRPVGVSLMLFSKVVKNLDEKLWGDGAPDFPTPREQALAQYYQMETLQAAGQVKLIETYLEETLRDPKHDLDDIANVSRIAEFYRASAATLPRYN